jgi:tetratricopeptide (TPR) repeat protein
VIPSRTFARAGSAATLMALLTLSPAFALAQTAPGGPRPLQPPAASAVVLERGDADLFAATLAGRYAQSMDDPDLAARAFARAWMARPGDAALLARAVGAALDAHDVTEALRLSRLARPEIRSNEAALTLAIDALAQSRWAEARRHLTGRQFAPELAPLADQARAFALLGLRDVEGAVTAAARTSGVRAIDRVSLIGRALVLEEAGRVEEALAAYESAWRSDARQPVGVLAHAAALHRAGRKERALEILATANAARDVADPALAAAHAAIGAGAAAPPRPGRRRAAAIALTALAGAMAEDERLDGAIAQMALARHVDPRFDAALVGLSRALMRRGRTEAAEPLLVQIAADSAHFPAAASDLASLTHARDPEAGLAVARDAARRSPGRATGRVLAELLAATDRHEEAAEAYAALLREPDARQDWTLLYGRGAALERLGRWSEAEADMREALVASPRNPTVLNHLGYALAERGERLDEAIAMLRQAVRLRPQSGHVLDSLGWALVKAGKTDEAVSQLERALSLAPGVAAIADHLGDAYWQAGRHEEARLEWRRALSLGLEPGGREAVEAKLARPTPGAR